MTPSPRPIPSLGLALLAALACLAVPAAAQSAPTLAITPASTAVSLADNQTRELAWTVGNSGPSPADTQVTLSVPPGWRAQLASESRFTLAANVPAAGGGGTRAIQVTVGPEPGVQPPAGVLTLRAVGTNAAGQSGEATATVALTYLPPPPPPPVPDNPWPLLLGLLAGAALLAAAAAYLASARRLQLQLSALDFEERPGARATATLRVTNRSRKARRIDLRVHGLAMPWSGALMVPHVLLDAGAATEIPLLVNIPRAAVAGQACRFEVHGKPHGRFPWLVRRRLQARVLAEPPRPAHLDSLLQP